MRVDCHEHQVVWTGQRTRMRSLRLMVASIVMLLAFGAATGVAVGADVPVLWGVDEDDGQLFSMDDYTSPLSSFTSYGRLQWDDNGHIRNIGRHIEAFTIDVDGTAYMVRNADVGGICEPILMSLDLNNVDPSGGNIVNVIGRIAVDFDSGGDNITGLSFDPQTGDLYALFRDNGSGTVDRLIVVNKADGSVLTEVGLLEGMGMDVGSGEDLTFDGAGRLFVTDDHGDYLYQVDPLTAEILGVVDNYQRGGLGGGSVKFEGLAWDPMNDRIIGTDDKREYLAWLTPGDGDNILYGDTSAIGLTDIEGIGFVPEPGTVVFLAVAAVVLYRRRRTSLG